MWKFTAGRLHAAAAGGRHAVQLSEQAVHRDAQHAQGALVFEAFRGLVEFLEGHLGVLEEAVVVDQFADAALALVAKLEVELADSNLSALARVAELEAEIASLKAGAES